MKIAVFSDTHGFSRGMINAVEEYKPDQIIHLGDGMPDAEKVREMFPQIPVCCVPGNCDGYYDDEEAYKLITLGRSRHFSHTATAMPCAAASSMCCCTPPSAAARR